MAAIPPDRLRALLQQPGNADNRATGAATPPPPPAGPMAAPMATPEPKMGDKEGGLINLSMALDLIQQAIMAIGPETQEGQKAEAAIKLLHGILGPSKPRTDELQPAEIQQLLGSLPQAGNVTPEVAAALGPRPSQNPKPVAPPLPTGKPMPAGMPGAKAA